MFVKKLLEGSNLPNGGPKSPKSVSKECPRLSGGTFWHVGVPLGAPWTTFESPEGVKRRSGGTFGGAGGGPLGAPGLQNECQRGPKWRPNWCLFADADFSETGVLLKREHRFGRLGVVLGAKAARNFVTSFRFSLWGPCFAVCDPLAIG